MNLIRSVVTIVILLAAFIMAALAVNQSAVSLNFMLWQTPELSIFWWLLGAFALGMTVGLINTLWLNLKHRRANKKLQQQLAAKDKAATDTQREVAAEHDKMMAEVSRLEAELANARKAS